MRILNRDMTLNELRSVVRKTISLQLKEARQKMSTPKSLSDFRLALSRALEKAGAPADLVEEVADTGYEGGGVFSVISATWDNISAELTSLSETERQTEYAEIGPSYAHDVVLDIAYEYKNNFNYEPGRRPARFDELDLANKVKSIMFPAKKKTPREKSERELSDMMGLVTDMVTESGGRIVSTASNSVKFSAPDTEAFELNLPTQAKLAGLRQVGPQTWYDEITKLRVTFGLDTAVVQ